MRALVASLLLSSSTAFASSPPVGPGPLFVEWEDRSLRESDPEPKEFSLINYFFTRSTVTNQLADPSGLRGVSLGPIGVGEGVGSATAVGSDTTAFYVEQRWIPVVAYSPNFVDGLATFRAQFEIDFMWGQAANQIQNNQGGGFNADQVNIQTKNVNVGIYPTKNPKQLSLLVGTQSVYDSIYDPTITSLFDIVRTGYKLSFLGSDATGVSAFANLGGLWKASFMPLGAAQPKKATEDDPSLAFVYLGTLDYAYPIQPGTVVGLSFWHLEDDTRGAAFAFEGLVKSGPASSGLSSYTGTGRMNIEAASGRVEYIGANFHHNINFRTSDFAASGFVMLNEGRFTSTKPDSEAQPTVHILGLAANLELAYHWGRAASDVITLEGMFTTGDKDPNDDKYTSAFTLNQYGLPGAVWFNHKTLILFPFTSTVSNYTGAIVDISNQGYGVLAGILAAKYDLIRDTLNVKVGAAYAQSTVRPPATDLGIERGSTVGAEVNVELTYQIRYLMQVGLHGAYLFAGNFFDGNPGVLTNPYAVFTTFTWYAF
jgi:hypothetical protein